MNSFEWMELQTLTADIAEARSRLSTARSSRNPRHIRGVEHEIAAAEARRSRLIAHLSTHLADNPKAHALADSGEAAAPPGERRTGSTASRSLGRVVAPMAAGAEEGDIVVWEKLTPADIARATGELGARRAAVLARHADELRALEADQGQLESLARAIDAFMRKYLAPEGVFALAEDRDRRMQARA